jgi:hypothetical protein
MPVCQILHACAEKLLAIGLQYENQGSLLLNRACLVRHDESYP